MRRLTKIDDDSDQSTDDTVDDIDVTSANDIDECPECGSHDIAEYEHEGEVVCEDCGLVLSDSLIDHGPEWRSFPDDNSESKRRTGPPRTELRHDRGTTATIDWRDQDAHGNRITSSKQQQMNRLRQLDEHAKRDSSERRLAYANGEIKRMGSALGAPTNIQETAAALYREAHNKDLIPGRSIEAIASACLYIALRVHNEPRSLDEVTNVSHMDKKPIQSAQQYLTRELDITLEPVNPSEYIHRFATKLSLPQSIIRISEQLLDELKNTHHTSGNHPGVLAASALYAASLIDGQLITQKSLKNASNVTEVSIRNNYPMFLTETDAVDIDTADIQAATTPSDIAQLLNDGPVEYLSHTTQHAGAATTDSDSTGNGNGYTCNTCGSKFTTERDLLDHRNEHHTDDTQYTDADYNFACAICPFIGDTFHSVRVHSGRSHPHFDPATTTRHSLAVDPDDYPPTSPTPTIRGTHYTCEYCDDTFQTLDNLHIHQDISHDEARNTNDTELTFYATIHIPHVQYACPECETTTPTPAALESHLHSNHDGDDYNRPQHYRVTPSRDEAVTTVATHTPVPESAPVDIYDHSVNTKTDRIEAVYDAFAATDTNFHNLVQALTAAVIGVGGIHVDDPDTTRSFTTALANATYAAYNTANNTIGQDLTRSTVYDAFDVDDTDLDTYIAYQNLLDWIIDTAPHA